MFFLEPLAFPFAKLVEIDLGLVSIKIWGLLVSLGMLAGLLVSYYESKRKKVSFDLILDLFIWVFIAAMLGGRLFYVLLFWKDFAPDPLSIFYFWEGGMVFYGGVIGALIAILVLLYRKKARFWKIADVLVPGTALGIGIGRIGCYLSGLHIGAKTNFFLGSEYNGEIRHEPALYLSLNGFVLFIFLMLIRKHVKKEGQLAWIFLLWDFGTRFFLDFFRANDLPGHLSDPRFVGLTISQILGLIAFLALLPWGFQKFFNIAKRP